MIDAVPQLPAAQEQVIRSRIEACGLSAGGFIVRYERQLQDLQIVFSSDAGVTSAQFPCVRDAADGSFITFRDEQQARDFDVFTAEQERPRMLAMAEAALKRYGSLKDFPERTRYASLALYAQALEHFCRVKPGAYLADAGGLLTITPAFGVAGKGDFERQSCLMSALFYASAKNSDVKFGFIGREVSAPDP